MVEQTRVRRFALRPVPLHPLLVAVVPALFLFAENAVQEVTFDPLWLPLALSAAIGIGTLLAGVALLRDGQRGALLATWALLLFFSFGHAWNLVVGVFDGRRYLVAVYLLIGLAGALAIWRGRGWVPGANRALTVAAALLVAFNLVRIGGWAVGSTLAEGPSAPPPISVVAPEHPRDIYYVILDRYANAETLQRLYGFDNTPFLDALRAARLRRGERQLGQLLEDRLLPRQLAQHGLPRRAGPQGLRPAELRAGLRRPARPPRRAADARLARLRVRAHRQLLGADRHQRGRAPRRCATRRGPSSARHSGRRPR